MKGEISKEVKSELIRRALSTKREILEAAEKAAAEVDPFEYDKDGAITHLKFDHVKFDFGYGETIITLSFKGMEVYRYSPAYLFALGTSFNFGGIDANMEVKVTS